MIFSKKLKQLRQQAGWSQEELADRLAVSRQAVAKWEAGVGLPDIDNLQKLANIFTVSLDTLLDYNHATALGAVREPIDIKTMPTEKSKSWSDVAITMKYPDAAIQQLVRMKKLSWLQRITDFIISPGIMDLTYSLSDVRDRYYLVEKADRQWLVTVTKTAIESCELVKPFTGQKLTVDDYEFVKLKRFL